MRQLFLSLSIALATITIGQQTQSDSYTRYELLEPSSQSFRIIYDVSATTAGAAYYWNTLRKGSEHKVDKVIDLYSGKELKWEIISGSEARANGLTNASDDFEYLQIELIRPIPNNGETRLRIDKTYRDPASYYQEGEIIVFDRSLGIRRNAVVLPEGYELIETNYPSQINTEQDGRLVASFMNNGVGGVPYKLKARRFSNGTSSNLKEESPWPDYKPTPQGRDRSKARLDYTLNERAFQDREIVYFCNSPKQGHSGYTMIIRKPELGLISTSTL